MFMVDRVEEIIEHEHESQVMEPDLGGHWQQCSRVNADPAEIAFAFARALEHSGCIMCDEPYPTLCEPCRNQLREAVRIGRSYTWQLWCVLKSHGFY